MHTLRSFLTSSRRVRLLIGVLLVASAGLIANRVFVAYDESRARLDRHYLETTDDAARAIVASLSEFSRYVVEREITTPEILTAIGEGIKSGDLETARSFLRDELGELYETLREFRFNQLHVHLPDGRSLLRMHAPDVWGDSLYGVRESVSIVQRERRPVSGFEAGRISAGYRFVYPLAWEGEDLGSVELSSSFDTIAAALFEEFDKPGELLVRRETLDEALLDNEAFRYGETPLAQEYLVDYRTVEGAEPAWVDRVRREIHGRSTIRGATGVDIVVPVSIDRVGYAVVMLSVEDVRGAHVGYFVTYQQTDEYRALLAETSERAILIGLALGALVLVLLLANRARELAVSANRSKSQFLANVSHELRTPMTGVMGMIEALEEPGTSKAERTEYLRLLRGAGNDMVHIVNSILEMSRIEAGRVELHREPFAPATVIGDMVDSMRTSEIAGGLEIRFSADDEAYRRVMGDPLRLRQIVTNVFHNALKFTQEGGVTVGVSTRVRDERAAMVEVTVTDTGIGIPEEQLPQIFEKFAQGTSAITQTYGGSGLGLSIVKSLVDLMGGGIQISSVEGVGTTVYVKLPCELATGSDERRPAVGVRPEPAPSRTPPMKPPVARDPSEVRDTKSDGGSLRVLLAEDDTVSQHVAVALLARHGMHVVVAANGLRAFELGKDGGFDVILMDRRMPELDGLEATERLVAYWDEHGGARVPIIGLSGLVSPEDRARCTEAGMSGFVSKPIDAAELIRVIRSHANETEPLDLSQTEASLGDVEEVVSDILPIFLQQTAERLLAIEYALERRDHLAIHEQTHPLKTAARYLGANELSDTARTIDDACRNETPPDWDEITPLVTELRKQVARIERWRSSRVSTL